MLRIGSCEVGLVLTFSSFIFLFSSILLNYRINVLRSNIADVLTITLLYSILRTLLTLYKCTHKHCKHGTKTLLTHILFIEYCFIKCTSSLCSYILPIIICCYIVIILHRFIFVLLMTSTTIVNTYYELFYMSFFSYPDKHNLSVTRYVHGCRRSYTLSYCGILVPMLVVVCTSACRFGDNGRDCTCYGLIRVKYAFNLYCCASQYIVFIFYFNYKIKFMWTVFMKFINSDTCLLDKIFTNIFACNRNSILMLLMDCVIYVIIICIRGFLSTIASFLFYNG